VADHLQVLFAFDLAKTAHEVKELAGRLDFLIRLQAVEKVIDRRAQCARDLVQEGGRYGSYPKLVLVDRLLRHAVEPIGQIAPAQPKHESAIAKPRADKLVSGSGGSAPSGFVRGGALFLVGKVDLGHQSKVALHPLLRLPRRGNAGKLHVPVVEMRHRGLLGCEAVSAAPIVCRDHRPGQRKGRHARDHAAVFISVRHARSEAKPDDHTKREARELGEIDHRGGTASRARQRMAR